MRKHALIDALSAYRRPASPMYRDHFRGLAPEVTSRSNATALRAILRDQALPARVREHAAGALGETEDSSATSDLIVALASRKLRRGAAVALGRLKAKAATGALEALAHKEPVARWALAQIRAPATVADALTQLRTGHLREIPHTLSRLSNPLKKKVQARIMELFRDAVAAGGPTPDDRWLITSVEHLAPRRAGTVLAEALHHANRHQKTACPSVRHRLLRAIRTVLPPQALPALAQTVCMGGNPTHVRMAVLNIKRILAQRDRRSVLEQAERIPRRHRDALKQTDIDALLSARNHAATE